MSKGVIGVDVDLTVADSDVSHLHWLCSKVRCDPILLPSSGPISYDLSEYFPDLPKEISGDDFWRIDYLYDDTAMLRPVQPVCDSVEVLRKLSENGWEIVFISHVKGNHHKSKYNWLKRHFPFMDGFIATQEKYYVNCDVFIDDRNKHLIRSEADVNIKFHTLYEQDVELGDDCLHLVTNDWNEIGNYIGELR